MPWCSDSLDTGPCNVSDKNSTNLDTDSLSLVIPMTFMYAVIFLTGLLGNISTCIVISRNKYMHTATNYYLFSLAISDLLLLISGLPPEMYRIWSPQNYMFGATFCIIQGFAAETSANATVLTITAFTIERYVAICHPFLSHTMSKLSRAIKYIVVIWIGALCLAVPQAIQFGVHYEDRGDITISECTVVTNFIEHAFEISTFLFFVGPMTLITVLYILIAIKLTKSQLLSESLKRASVNSNSAEPGVSVTSRTVAQKRVIKMLVAVVAAFFLCWAPFHAQRLLARYLISASEEAQNSLSTIYITLMHTSGILYFLSTTINPVLYNIMSNKFREAFKNTFLQPCTIKEKANIRRSIQRSASDEFSQLQNCNRGPFSEVNRLTRKNLHRQNTDVSQTTDMTLLTDLKRNQEPISENVNDVLIKVQLNNRNCRNNKINYKTMESPNGKYLTRYLNYFGLIKNSHPRKSNQRFLRIGRSELTNTVINPDVQGQDVCESEFIMDELMH